MLNFPMNRSVRRPLVVRSFGRSDFLSCHNFKKKGLTILYFRRPSCCMTSVATGKYLSHRLVSHNCFLQPERDGRLGLRVGLHCNSDLPSDEFVIEAM